MGPPVPKAVPTTFNEEAADVLLQTGFEAAPAHVCVSEVLQAQQVANYRLRFERSTACESLQAL